MKDFLKGMLIITLSLMLVPAVPFLLQAKVEEDATPTVSQSAQTAYEYSLIEEVAVYDAVKQASFTMSIEDYLVASLFYHLKEDAHPELIKAQTVIMYTYILGRRADELANPTAELHGADISTDRNKYLGFMLEDEARMRCGDSYEAMLTEYKAYISEVLGVYCAYKGEPIDPAFCYSSGGKTQSALTVLGEDVAYLQSVESEWDEEYVTELSYTSAEVFARITSAGEGYTLYTEPSKWLSPKKVTPDGYIVEMLLDGTYSVSGRWLAQVLNLPSAKFCLSYSLPRDRFTFEVRGSGHLVGFSQYGAQKMAEQGADWRELLSHYYTDIEICGG